MKSRILHISMIIAALTLLPAAVAGAQGDGPYRNPAGKMPPGQAKKYDDGRYHPGGKRDDGWRYRRDDPQRRHGDRYDKDRRGHRYDRDDRKHGNHRPNKNDGGYRDRRHDRDGARSFDHR